VELFTYSRATVIDDAIAEAGRASTAQHGAEVRFVAGGTTLIDLMKLDVERPRTVVDINKLPLQRIGTNDAGVLEIGALARNSVVADHPTVRREFAALSEALLSGASGQLRNMATTAGNLLQRTRCDYFRTVAAPCNKRVPGSGCSAIDGENRGLALLGTSDDCIATNPSDQNVALAAFDASIRTRGPRGERTIPIEEFFLLPGSTPQRENVLESGELIVAIDLPAVPAGTRSTYTKLRDRASYQFALASTAAVAVVEHGVFADVRIALGGIATVPWRARAAERSLVGKPPSREGFVAAADIALRDALPRSENGFKVELARRAIVHSLSRISSPTPQDHA